MEKIKSFTFSEKFFSETYNIEDYMIYLIELCSINEKQQEHFTKLYKKYVKTNRIFGIINLLNEMGLLFEEKEPKSHDTYLNSLLTYSFAIENCIPGKHDNIKIDLTIKCGKISKLISEHDFKEEDHKDHSEKDHKICKCNYLESAIIMYNIAVEILERTNQNPQKLSDVLFDIAEIQKKQKKYRDAIETLNKSLRIIINLKTINHQDSIYIISELACLHRFLLEFGKAFTYYNIVLKHQMSQPNNHLQIINTMINLGHVSFYKGNSIEALYYYTTCLKNGEKILSLNHKIIEDILNCLSRVYIYSNQFEKAFKYKQILFERGLSTKTINDIFEKYCMDFKFCSCCYQIKEKLFLCSGCHKVHYCNQEHQIKDWSNHKLFCSQEKLSRIKLQLLKPKFMALTQKPQQNESINKLFYLKNRILYKKANEGDIYSILKLGDLCIYNDYKEEALKWFTKAAVKGESMGEYYIGLAYLYGRGIHKSTSEAIKWLLLASNKYNKDAQFDLGILYYNIHNTDEGVGWIKLAAVQGQQKAIKMLKDIGLE